MFDFFKKIFSNNNEKNKIEFTSSITVSSSYTDEVDKTLKTATIKKNEKNFDEACLLLKKAYKLGGNNISIVDRLRLPMYLQLANKNDEGWKELSILFGTVLDAESQYTISKQIRIFLHKEKKFLPAVPYGLYSYCKLIENYRYSINRKRNDLENNKLLMESYFKMNDEIRKYSDGRWEEEGMNQLLKSEKIEEEVSKLLKKAKKDNLAKSLSNEIKKYIDSNLEYDFVEINNISKSILL